MRSHALRRPHWSCSTGRTRVTKRSSLAERRTPAKIAHRAPRSTTWSTSTISVRTRRSLVGTDTRRAIAKARNSGRWCAGRSCPASPDGTTTWTACSTSGCTPTCSRICATSASNGSRWPAVPLGPRLHRHVASRHGDRRDASVTFHGSAWQLSLFHPIWPMRRLH